MAGLANFVFTGILLVHSISSGNCKEEIFFAAGRDKFVHDKRFHWENFPDIERKPPDLFPSKSHALFYQHLVRLPRGLSEDEFQFFQGVFELLRSRLRVYDLMQSVSGDLRALIASRPAPSTERARILSLLALMRSYEEHYGLGLAEVRQPLSMRVLQVLLAQGQVLVDWAGADLSLTLGPGERVQTGHWRHSRLSHRLQMHLVLRDLTARPEAYGSPPNVAELYRKMGSEELHSRLDWSQSGLAPDSKPDQLTLFFQLFDSPENNPSSPGFFSEYNEYWPDVPIL